MNKVLKLKKQFLSALISLAPLTILSCTLIANKAETISKSESVNLTKLEEQKLNYCSPFRRQRFREYWKRANTISTGIGSPAPSDINREISSIEKEGSSIIKNNITEAEIENFKRFSQENKSVVKEDAPILEAEEVLTKIHKRTFTLAIVKGCLDEKETELNLKYRLSSKEFYEPVLTANFGGNLWLLDYAYDRVNNRYKLFFGTNLDVANNIREFGTYEPSVNEIATNDPYLEKTFGFWFGKSKDLPNLKKENDEVSPIFYSQKGVSKNFKEVVEKSLESNSKLWSSIFSDFPKVIFVAVNFLKSEAKDNDFFYIKWLTHLRNSIQAFFKERNNITDQEVLNYEVVVPISLFYQPNEFKDFAVVALDYNADKLEESLEAAIDRGEEEIVEDLSRIKNWINDAIFEVKNEQDRNLAYNFRGKDNNSGKWWDQLDFATAARYAKVKNLNFNFNNKVYYGGYSVSEWNSRKKGDFETPVWESRQAQLRDVQNQKNNGKNFMFADFSLSNSSINFYEHYSHRYGFSGYFLDDDISEEEQGNTTGALVLNGEGLTVGVLGNRRVYYELGVGKRGPKKEAKYKRERVFDMFLQTGEIPHYVKIFDFNATNEEGKGYYSKLIDDIVFTTAYNLLDHHNSKQIKKQKNSYRLALNKWFPNGPFNNGITTTLLFSDYKIPK